MAKEKASGTIEYPLDKVNNVVWTKLLESENNTQVVIKAEKNSDSNPVSIIYSIDFDEFPDNFRISRKLDSFDKRVYVAIASLFNEGNTAISFAQVYYRMGYTTKPMKYINDKIFESIKKMIGARISINNVQEAEAYAGFTNFNYMGPLLPIEVVSATDVNKLMTKGVIIIDKEPPLMKFARARNQLTAFPVKYLQSDISKTEANLKLEDYLLMRISRARTGRMPATILYSTLHEAMDITSYKQKERLPVKIHEYFEHYKATGLISNYNDDGTKITFSFRKEIE